jgi:hypothetical protein
MESFGSPFFCSGVGCFFNGAAFYLRLLFSRKILGRLQKMRLSLMRIKLLEKRASMFLGIVRGLPNVS